MNKKMKEIKGKDARDLRELVEAAKETLRTERFKDRASRKAHIIRTAKGTIARAQTELSVLRRNSAQ